MSRKKSTPNTDADEKGKGRPDTTVMKAFQLFETLAASATPMGISSLSQTLSLQKSNVHRLLRTLTALGYVRQDLDTKRYLPTLRAWEVGSTIVRRDRLRIGARRILNDLHRATGESVYLSVLSGGHVLYLDTIDAAHSMELTPQPGVRTPAVFPASGKAILANQRDVMACVDRCLAALPDGISVDRGELLGELEKIRAQGFATTVNGWRRGASSLAAPVMTIGMIPTAAIGILASADHLPLERILSFAPQVMNAAARIAESGAQASVSAWED